MTLETLFQSATQKLREKQVPFAVAGALASDLYRRDVRLTMDIDIIISAEIHNKETAIAVIESLGLNAGLVRQADLAGGPLFAIRRRSTEVCMIVGRPTGHSDGEGVDILLPAIPWVKNAVERAQANMVDFGFGDVPAITLEDAILAKLYALQAARLRAKDLDDLQSIFEADHAVDVPYLSGQMRCFGIIVPTHAKPFLPDWLIKLSQDISRSNV